MVGLDSEATPEPGRITAHDDETLTADPSAALGERGEALLPGARIGRFTLLRKLGEGGMGIVHAAYDDELDRKIAIKLVRAERVDDLARARVLREAQAMARVSHPNVVQIYEVGMHGEQVYVAMEFVAGPTLAGWTATCREHALASGQLAWPAILACYLDAGRGLAAAHAAGLVHRDFKPANAIVGDDGRVRVLDFGIARPIAGALPRVRSEPDLESALASNAPTQTNQSTTLTRTGAMVGTPAYMSLEQFEGGNVDARSDQFSFCVALWEALYGERPFEGRTPGALILAMREGSLRREPATSGVPLWLRDRIRRGLASDPRARWPSMDALLQALSEDPQRRRRAWWRRSLIAGVGLTLLASSWAFAHEQMASADRAEHDRAQALADEASARAREAEAQAERDRALDEARSSAQRARDIARILAARSLSRDPTLAAALLREVESPVAADEAAEASGWRSAALEVLQRPISRHVIAPHEDRVVDLEFSPDGAWLASASFDGRVRLWSSAALGSGHYYELAHDDRVFDVDFDPSGRRLVSSSRDLSARVWTVPEQPPSRAAEPIEPSHILRGHTNILWTARFDPSGDRVVTASRDGSVRVWPIAADREPSPSQALHSEEIAWHAEFSPDGSKVAVAASDGSVRLWDLGLDQVRELSRHADVAWVAHFSPEGRWVASASKSGELKIDAVDPERGDEGSTLRGHTGSVQRLRYSPDGRMLASCSHDWTTRLWPLDEQGRPSGPARVIEAGNAFANSPAFSADSRWLAIAGVEPTVRVIEVAGGQPIELRGHTSDVFALRFSPDGTRLVTGSHDRSLRVWDTDWAKVERRFDGDPAANEAGRWLIEQREDGRARPWRISANQITPRGIIAEPVTTTSNSQGWGSSAGTEWVVLVSARGELVGIELDERSVDDAELVPRWAIAGVGPTLGLQLSVDGRWLVAATLAGELLLWHFAEGLAGGPRPVSLAKLGRFSTANGVFGIGNEGRSLVTTSVRGDVRITTLDPERGTVGESREFEAALGGRTKEISFDPQGEWMGVAAIDRNFKVWSIDSLEQPVRVSVLASDLRLLGYDARADRLVLGCDDGTVHWLDPDSGELGELAHLSGTPTGLDPAQTRPWLALATDVELQLRDDRGDPIRWGFESGIRRIDFVGEDRRLLVADARGTLRVLVLGEQIDGAGLLARLREVSDYCPSVDERVRYAGESPEAAARSCLPSALDHRLVPASAATPSP